MVMNADALAPRKAAHRLILGVIEEGRMLEDAAPGNMSGPDRARALALARATMRWMGPVDAVLQRFVKRAPELPGLALLRLGATEILALDAAPHGVVHACVELSKGRRDTSKLSGLVNAVLRKVAAEGPAIWEGLDLVRLASPDWLWRQMRADWGKDFARAIAEAHLNAPPVDLTSKSDAQDWADALDADLTPNGSIRLKKSRHLTEAPGFAEGAWWAQDAAAATAARLAGSGNGRRALDLCAAPGGKTMQLASAGWQVTALDNSPERMKRVEENLSRTGLSADLVVADALEWSPDELFDLVLLDAPCTATGTIRRHPELPHIRDGGGVEAATSMQSRLLSAAWGMLKPGGRLIYATCSLNRAEGERQTDALLAARPDAARVPVTADETGDLALITKNGDYRTRPDHWANIGGMDGFYAARIEKAA